MRKIDTYEYVSTLKELVEEGHEACVQICGNSMSPFLRHNRDSAFFKAPDRALEVGDIVFYQRTNGQYILHRICKIDTNGYYVVGDNQQQIEGPILREQIFAVVTQVLHNGKYIKPGNFLWEFYAKIWIHIIPLRARILRLKSF